MRARFPKTKNLLGATLIVLATAIPAIGQDETPTSVTVQNRSGDLPFSMSVGSDIEHVDVGSGNLVVHIPLSSVKGRGLDFNFGLNYDARYWVTATRQVAPNPPFQIWNVALGNYLNGATTGLGWQPNQSYLSLTNATVSCGTSRTAVAHFHSHYIYQDAMGGKSALAVRTGTATCDSGSFTLSDLQGPDWTGKGMWASTPSIAYTPAVYTADGTQTAWATSGTASRPLGTFKDANGNTLQQVAGGLDTLGRTIVTQQNGTNQILYKIYDSSGTQQTYVVNFTNISLSTSFGATGQYGAIAEYTGTRSVITSIVLPNGRSYSFQYEAGTYGAITRIDLPTGAYVTYTWGTLAIPNQGDHAVRYVTSRTLHTDGQAYTWTFSMTCSSMNAFGVNCTNTVTDPLNQQSVYALKNGNVTQAKIYNGAATGTPLRQYDITYADYGNPYSIGEGDLFLPSVVQTTLDNGLVSKKEFDYNDIATYSWSECDESDPLTGCPTDGNGNLFVDTESAPRGNVTEMREYDWGSGSPGPLVRRTKYTYLHNSNSNYLTYHIVDKVLTQTICNGVVSCSGNGDQAAQTQYEYDNYVAGDNPMQGTAAAAEHDYTNYSTNFIYRGNATRLKRWRNTDSALLTTTYEYDDLGNIRFIKDPLGHTTTFDYTDSFANGSCLPPSGQNGQAYVSTVTNPLSQQIRVVRYPCTSLVQGHKDQNDINAGRAGTTYSYDWMGRVTAKNFPDGGQTSSSYNDVPPVSTTTTTKINSGMNLVSVSVGDALGRTVQTQVTSDPQGTVYTDTSYDALGRVHTVSNPYRTGGDITTTTGTTTYTYDALDRKISESYPDGSVLTTAYCGSTTLVTDPTARWRRSTSDALGRLVEVDEPNAPGATVNSNGCPGSGEPIWVTSYAFDTLGNLTQVVQNGSRQRNFTYDSLSHLLTAANPESGTVSYSYDNDGVLTSKLDARGISTTYSHDALNRLTQKSYSDSTLSAFYTYDGPTNGFGVPVTNVVGRMTESWTGTSCCASGGAEIFGYDPMGRILINEQYTPSMGFKPVTYTYDFAGNTTSVSYPSGRVINYSYDSGDRPSTATDASNGITYAAGFKSSPGGSCIANVACYTPQGTFYALSIGQTSTFNGLNLTHIYNARLQPQEFKASSTGGNAIDISYSFADPANGHNAGHVFSLANNIDSTRSQTFGYDQLNRITSAQTTSTYATSPAHCWGEIYGLDPWSNLTQIAATTNSAYNGCSEESGFTASVDGNNHFGSFGYDASGNTTGDGTFAYAWNAESQLASAAGVTYTYDAEGRRVTKSSGKNYIYDLSGDILAETDGSGNTLNEYVFFGGKRIATLPAGGNPLYYVEDLLGTSRILTDSSGVVCYDSDFYPYGGERAYVNNCPQNYKFEGKERDTETGNDDFGARYYSNRFGRWLSADWSAVPVPVPYANLTNPQTLSLYAMVADDPESFADLNGHCPACVVEELEELAESPAGQEVIDHAVGLGVAGLALASGALGKAADYLAAHGNELARAEPGYAGSQVGLYLSKRAESGTQQTTAPQQNESTPANPQGPNYQPNPKHDRPGGEEKGGVSPQPEAGSSLMDQAVQVKPGSSVAVDRSTGKFVVYRTDANGQTHGYQTTWKGLRNEQRAALIKAGLATKRGKIIQLPPAG